MPNEKWKAAIEAARAFNAHAEERLGDIPCLPDRPCPECRALAQLIRRQLQPLEQEITVATGGIGPDWLDGAGVRRAPPQPKNPPATKPMSPSLAELEEAEKLASDRHWTTTSSALRAAELLGTLAAEVRIRWKEADEHAAEVCSLQDANRQVDKLRSEWEGTALRLASDPAPIGADAPANETAAAAPDVDPISPAQIEELKRINWRQPSTFSEVTILQKLTDLALAGLRFRDREIERQKRELEEARGKVLRLHEIYWEFVHHSADLMEAAVNQAYRDCAARLCSMCAEHKPILPSRHLDCAPFIYHEVAGEAVHCDAADLRTAYPDAFADEKPAPKPEAPEVVIARERKAAALDMLRHCVAVAHEHIPYGSSVAGALEREFEEMTKPARPPGPPDPPRPKGDNPVG
jgi:hypothetical protein